MPKRPLGKTGVEITMLDQGTGKGAGLDRILRFAYAQGVRASTPPSATSPSPTSRSGSSRSPRSASRSSSSPRTSRGRPREITACSTSGWRLGTDYLDLFFIHSFGDNHSLDEAIKFVKSQEFKEAAEAVKKSGKAQLVGFSTHHKDRAAILQAAAEGGFVDAIMLQYCPWLDKDSPLNKALDACRKKGIGLISMKQIAGRFSATRRKGNILDDVAQQVPDARRAEAHAVPGPAARDLDRRADQRRLRGDAEHRPDPREHRRRPPVRAAQGGRDPPAPRRRRSPHGPTLCADCDGRCADGRRHQAALGDLTRFLTYHEHHGDRAEARRRTRAPARGPRLVRRRPRRRPRRLPQPARFRQAAAGGRSAAGVTAAMAIRIPTVSFTTRDSVCSSTWGLARTGAPRGPECRGIISRTSAARPLRSLPRGTPGVEHLTASSACSLPHSSQAAQIGPTWAIQQTRTRLGEHEDKGAASLVVRSHLPVSPSIVRLHRSLSNPRAQAHLASTVAVQLFVLPF